MSNEDILHIAAGADLSGANGQYRALAIGGTLVGATPNALAVGILQNKPKNTEDAAVKTRGRSKFQAGAAVAAGARLKCASGGFMITAASGDAVVGRSFFAVASGAYSLNEGGEFNFNTFGYHNGT